MLKGIVSREVTQAMSRRCHQHLVSDSSSTLSLLIPQPYAIFTIFDICLFHLRMITNVLLLHI